MNATQISTQLSPLNLLSLLKSRLKWHFTAQLHCANMVYSNWAL